MTRSSLLAAIAVVLAGALALALARDPGGVEADTSPAASAALGDPRAELEALRAALENEAFAREMLAAEVELMRTVIERLALELVETTAETPEELARKLAGGRSQVEPNTDEQVMAQLGLAEREVRYLRARWDESQLARLEVTDRAAREGWLLKPRHRGQLAYLDKLLRAELGEADYDRMLYATDQPNRVVVQSVIGGSAAALVGVKTGDHLLSYADARVYVPKDLRIASASGVKGSAARLTVDRSGRRLTFVVPRGPLGVRMTAEKVPPTR